MRGTRVLIADRHPIVLQGLTTVLAAQPDFAIVASCSNGASCIEAIRVLGPDIALLDVAMPDISAPEILALTSSGGVGTHVVFFTALAEDRNLIELAAQGTCTVVTKDATPEVLIDVLRRVALGQPQPPLSPDVPEPPIVEEKPFPTQLTDRERQIMRLVSEGLSNKEIGRRLNIADGTIKVHLHHIFQKLDISNRTVLAALAISQNELSLALRESQPSAASPKDPTSAK
ncbi:response regulator transcription factor [Bradyrhizobium manausense]|uniref:LuxR C-terminal-related transcriptional regulator n=1 Tax=Bradyrhizobium TaxID=374 RepID=UPI001BA90B05|nr:MULTISPECIES: response regulator transcription factor [Bradyrhizobium]MBR0830148.1 response regulator transcription factor [Bradyrhizobium manausense]UVO30884.1 response regulator transcription factor [Bradyrhizobium arachidis]